MDSQIFSNDWECACLSLSKLNNGFGIIFSWKRKWRMEIFEIRDIFLDLRSSFRNVMCNFYTNASFQFHGNNFTSAKKKLAIQSFSLWDNRKIVFSFSTSCSSCKTAQNNNRGVSLSFICSSSIWSLVALEKENIDGIFSAVHSFDAWNQELKSLMFDANAMLAQFTWKRPRRVYKVNSTQILLAK